MKALSFEDWVYLCEVYNELPIDGAPRTDMAIARAVSESADPPWQDQMLTHASLRRLEMAGLAASEKRRSTRMPSSCVTWRCAVEETWWRVPEASVRAHLRQRARTFIENEIRNKKMRRSMCACGVPARMYFRDASKPHEVTWMCRTCAALNPIPDVTDISPRAMWSRCRQSVHQDEAALWAQDIQMRRDRPQVCDECGDPLASPMLVNGRRQWCCRMHGGVPQRPGRYLVERTDAQGRVFRFRSTWEARFSEYCDLVGAAWIYEPLTLPLTTGRVYTPDFWVSEAGNQPVLVEIHRMKNVDPRAPWKSHKLDLARQEIPAFGYDLVICDETFMAITLRRVRALCRAQGRPEDTIVDHRAGADARPVGRPRKNHDLLRSLQ